MHDERPDLTRTPDVSARLQEEARRLHRAIFGSDADSVVVGRYVEAHRRALRPLTEGQTRWMEAAFRKKMDLEAIEFILRLTRTNDVLVRKFKVMMYLAEADPRSFAQLANTEPRRARAWSALCFHIVRSVLKGAKGLACLLILRWKVRHV